MENLTADEDFLPTFYDTPRIASAFSGWHYKDMREIVPFCQENDPEPPDFLEICLKEKLIKQSYGYELEIDEKKQKIIDARADQYYKENWSTVIMDILRYKNPLVANAHLLTSYTNKLDPKTKVYFHIDWLKPGRHTFVIQHDAQRIKLDSAEEKERQKNKKKEPDDVLGALLGLRKKAPEKPQKLKKTDRNFYVHNMLATFRTEVIPECK